MSQSAERAVAIVGVGAILPDAPNAPAFWNNVVSKKYSITETPPERWTIADHYDPDPSVPDKTYSKIGGWVRNFQFDWKRFRTPPRVAAAMDEGQQWAVTIAAEALADYGYPERPLNTDRTGVILGTAMGGELHYMTAMRVAYPEFSRWLNSVEEFSQLPADVRTAILSRWHEAMDANLPQITEDTMPGELPNIVSGRVANVLNLRGPNFITDAACASSLAAVDAAVEALSQGHVDAVIAGGVDRNMGAAVFVKFCKIGALSATGSRPFGEGADGFVMGEGSGAFLLKRLADAERDGDRIYSVIRGVGASSDGRGKGITAPNPQGQVLAVQRAWENADLDPATASLVEAHGTSTRVGDVAEVESLASVYGGARPASIALGSAKGNIGHLKAGAGAAGLLKTTMALYNRLLPPTLNAEKPNPNINFAATPFYLNHTPKPWDAANKTPRLAGVSAYGFGGTNFHLVMEEHVPGMLTSSARSYAGADVGSTGGNGRTMTHSVAPNDGLAAGKVLSMAQGPAAPIKAPLPLRGIFALGAATPIELKNKLDDAFRKAEEGWAPARSLPSIDVIRSPERLVIDFAANADLLDKLAKARKAAGFDNPQAWKALAGQGIFRGSGDKPGKVAFLFPGQGSQYANMGRDLVGLSPTFAAVFDEADRVMAPILGRPLTSYVFVDADDPAALKEAERSLMQTAITQPAMLTLDTAMLLLLRDYGFEPELVMGHSLGEYGALIAADVMPFAHALEASAARGAEMTKVSMGDNGWMAAVMAPMEAVEATLKDIDGYIVAANINSNSQSVVGGESKAVEQAIQIFTSRGFQAVRLPVSHAFHTKIVAPASGPLRKVLDRLSISEPRLPLVSNVTGDLYPTTVGGIKESLELQIYSPVQWVKGLETLYAQGVRTFVEVGPKKALKGFVDDVLGSKSDVVSLFTNHPKVGEVPTFNQALCGLFAAGYGADGLLQQPIQFQQDAVPATTPAPAPVSSASPVQKEASSMTPTLPASALSADALGQALMQLLAAAGGAQAAAPRTAPDRNDIPAGSVIISGTGLGLPGANKAVMDPDNAHRILRGEQFVDLIPERFRKEMAAKRITRVVKSEDGSGSFETIEDSADVIKLAGRAGSFNLTEEYGVPAKLVEALDITTQLAIASGLDALREASIPLVQSWRPTTKGTWLPDRWMLPEALRDETGVIFASAFPGGDRMADEFNRFYTWQGLRDQVESLEDLRRYTTDPVTLAEIERRIEALRSEIERNPYTFDRRFIFRILAMGHSQFAEFIGARGPNTHVNAACASTAQAVSLAEDWIRSGRCRRVVVVSADDVTSENLMGWIGSGFLSTGAAATDDRVEEAALPFDRRRHGTLLGMGACALVVESEDAIRERGMRGIVEVLSAETANSAFHGTRLDVNHICDVMDHLVTAAERRFGLNRYAMAQQMVFISHETFTPARGGSAAAEIAALRKTFGDATPSIVISNTKGFTGHPMGAGVEDVIAVKILEYGIVPPVPNYKEVDPELGAINLSRGGRYPVLYALHLAAGFGSQIAMTLIRRIPGGLDRVDNKPAYQRWLDDISAQDSAATEVVKRTLRVVSQGQPGSRTPAPSRWQYGTGPAVRTSAAGTDSFFTTGPQQMVLPSSKPVPVAQPAVQPAVQPAAQPAPLPFAPAPAPAAQPVAPVGAATPVAPAPAPVAPVGPVPAPVVQPTAPSPAEAAVNPIVDQVMAVVAEKTGYPQDMLDLSLDLEADLGIDTVKQAETFSAVRERFNIPALEGIKLRDYPTLGSVVEFVYAMRPELRQVAAPAPAPAPVSPVSTVAVVNPAPAPAVPASDPVVEQVMAVVAEKTGYPQEMLDADLDLEADLGIDTVKQAETFAAIRERFNIPPIDGLKLRDYPTLGSVVGFVYTYRPELKQSAVPAAMPAGQVTPAPTVAPSASAGTDAVTEQVMAVVAEKTGYPQEMLDADLDLEADLGIDTVKQAETFAAIRERFNIPAIEGLKLRDYPTLGSVVGFVYTYRPELKPSAAPAVPAPTPDAPVAASTAGDNGSLPPLPPRTPASVPAPAPVAVPADAVAKKVLQIVADKTGYPTEMLDLDSDLEADLGVDTVKQAETFAAVRTAFDIPTQDGLKLRDYPTLQSVIDFVYTHRPELKAAAAAPSLAPVPVGSSVPAVDSAGPTSAGSAGADIVATRVLGIVADKTGYPTEMLDLDSDLEADLGVDTVKQAETFAAVRTAFDIPPQDGLKLRDYPTLQSVIDFVYTHRPELKDNVKVTVSASTGTAQGAPAATGELATSGVQTIGTLEDADRMPRRVPVPSLRPALEWCKPTGVTLDAASRVVVMLDHGGVGKALAGRLQKRGVTVLPLESGITTEDLVATLSAWLAEGPIQGVYWLPALDVEPALEEMDLAQWRENNRVRVKNLFNAMRTLYASVAGPGRFLVAATRLGGLHGYGANGATAPMGGAVTGFTKAYNVEQSMRDEGKGTLVKAVDFEASRKSAEPADLLIDETLFDAGAVEIGYYDGLRYAITLEEQPARDGQPSMVLNNESVFVVTGAAGGITSAIVTDLAANSQGIFYLLDLVTAPARNDAHVALFRSDREELKRALIEEAKARGEKPTPVIIDKQIMGIERSEAALRAIESVEAAGGTAHYVSLNLMDGPAVQAVVDTIRERHGRIDVLLHAGGMLIDRILPNKEPSQFDLVFDIKADGFFSLVRAAKGMPIGATVSFSSVAGRFGNNGQSDYSSANDLLCKFSNSMKSWRPNTRGIAIDWTAWGQIGMASRGSVPQIMEALGIDMLAPECGVPTIRRELTYGGTRGEVLVAGRLGAWMAEKDPTGGLDVDKVNAMLAARKSPLLMVGKVTGAKLYGGIEVETTLDPAEQPFLFDHMVDEGVPWLPGVMGTEALAEVVSLLAPGATIVAVEKLDILGAFKFHRNKPQTLYLSATARPVPGDSGQLMASATLRSRFQPPKADLLPTVKDHFVTQVVLQRHAADAPVLKFKAPKEKALPLTAERIYQVFFHGPAYQVIERAAVEGNRATALMAHNLGPNTSPADAAELMAPRLVELCFQTAALWSIEKKQAMALPSGIDSVTVYRQPSEAGGKRLYAVVDAVEEGARYDAQVLDESGALYVDLKGYRTVQMPGEVKFP